MDPIDIAQKVLRIVFYVCVGIALYGFVSERFFDTPNTYWIWAGLGAIGSSIVRFFLRFV